MAIVVERKREESEQANERKREGEREEKKRNERTREGKKDAADFSIYVDADILCTDPDINFTEERERTHMHAKEKMRRGREKESEREGERERNDGLSSHFFLLCMYDNFLHVQVKHIIESFMYIHIHTHAYTHLYIYIYMCTARCD